MYRKEINILRKTVRQVSFIYKIFPAIRDLNGNEEFCFKQNGALQTTISFFQSLTCRIVQHSVCAICIILNP